jgi:hypothetical protein
MRSQAEIPVFKFWDEVKEYVSLGNGDFIICTQYWKGPPPIQPPYIIPIQAWGNAAQYERGFYVFARDLDELGSYLSYLVEANKDVWLVYFRVSVANIQTKIYYADICLRRYLSGEVYVI